MEFEPGDSVAMFFMLPVLVVLFTCSAIGSFVIWRLRLARHPARVAPFQLHMLHGEDRDLRHAVPACALGALALVLPVTLILRALGY